MSVLPAGLSKYVPDMVGIGKGKGAWRERLRRCWRSREKSRNFNSPFILCPILKTGKDKLRTQGCNFSKMRKGSNRIIILLRMMI